MNCFFFPIIFRSFHSLRLIFDDLATGCCIGSFPLKVKFFCLMFMREIFNRIWFSTKYESFRICPFQMVCVKGSKAPGKNLREIWKLFLKRVHALFWRVPSFIGVVYAAGDSFLFFWQSDSVWLAPFSLDNEKRAEQERPIVVIIKLFE